MTTKWFWARDQKQHGPVGLGELQALVRAGHIRRVDLIWKDGQADWIPAELVLELFPEVPKCEAATPAEPILGEPKVETTSPYRPFIGADGFMLFSPTADPIEMRSWAKTMLARGVFSAETLVRAIEFMRDGNRIKNPMAKLERWKLCSDALCRALQESKHFNAQALSPIIQGVADQLNAQLPEKMTSVLEDFHASNLKKINATKSGLRQLQISRTVLKEMSRLNVAELAVPISERFARILQHWRDQESLCAQLERD